MTEPEWLTCQDPQALIEFLCNATVLYRSRWQGWQPGRRFCISQRKLRLFACACCRRQFAQFPTENMRQAVLLAEKQADNLATEEELRSLVAQIVGNWDFRQAGPASSILPLEVVSSLPANRTAGPNTTWATLARFHAFLVYTHQVGGLSSGKDYAPEESACWRNAWTEEAGQQANLLRDIIGNPFLAVALEETWLHWNEDCLLRIARWIYDENRLDGLPVLADALEEAGCDNRAILDHCRAGGNHVRGCWLLDLVLNR